MYTSLITLRCKGSAASPIHCRHLTTDVRVDEGSDHLRLLSLKLHANKLDFARSFDCKKAANDSEGNEAIV